METAKLNHGLELPAIAFGLLAIAFVVSAAILGVFWALGQIHF